MKDTTDMSNIKEQHHLLRQPEGVPREWDFGEKYRVGVHNLRPTVIDREHKFLAFNFEFLRYPGISDLEYAEYFFDSQGHVVNSLHTAIRPWGNAPESRDVQLSSGDTLANYSIHEYKHDIFLPPNVEDNKKYSIAQVRFREFGCSYYSGIITSIDQNTFTLPHVLADIWTSTMFDLHSTKGFVPNERYAEKVFEGPTMFIHRHNKNSSGFQLEDWIVTFGLYSLEDRAYAKEHAVGIPSEDNLDSNYPSDFGFVIEEQGRNWISLLDRITNNPAYYIEWGISTDSQRGPVLEVKQTHIPRNVQRRLYIPIMLDTQAIADVTSIRAPHPKKEIGKGVSSLQAPWVETDRIAGVRLEYTYPATQNIER